ncbi:urease accessory protein UreF [Nonomuraea sp. CA-218870]|uniref:urease accessory protein UreF n=1 Tax=Nonomuraea sp. CA-218870 TaxID=3239998 RepID=UPI003D949479
MHPAILLLTDSRLPAGGHAHSGGAEQAVALGLVHDLPSLSSFLRGRLHTAGALAAALAAAACLLAARVPGGVPPSGDGRRSWELLDAEADARTASPAQREAARTQGRLLLRVARRLWPSPVLDALAGEVPSPHHPVALGAAAHAAGATPGDAALAAAYHAVTGPATAAVRLLGLDPVAVHGLLAGLTPELARLAEQAVTDARPAGRIEQADLDVPLSGRAEPADLDVPLSGRAEQGGGALERYDWGALGAPSAPALDLLAERHARATVRLFVS